MGQEAEVAIIAGATKALKYKKENPRAEIERVINHILREVVGKKDIKISAVAGASKAFEIKERNPRLGDKEIIQKVMKEIDTLLKNFVFEKA